jgi:hypothetical protein
MSIIINLTPHTVTVFGGFDPPHPVTVFAGCEYAPSGTVARVSMTRELIGTNPVPMYRSTPCDITDLPAPTAGTLYIVSAMVRLACPWRGDLLSPAELVRDETGGVVGCRSFDVN